MGNYPLGIPEGSNRATAPDYLPFPTLAQFPFDGDKLDISGNAVTLSVLTGTEQYRTVNGRQWLYINGSTVLKTGVVAALQRVGDVTMAISLMCMDTAALDVLILMGAPTLAVEADNYLYSFVREATGKMRATSYSGAVVANTMSLLYELESGIAGTLYYRRLSGITTVFFACQSGFFQIGPALADTPSGGTNGSLHIGGDGVYNAHMLCSNVWVSDAGLTTTQLIAASRQMWPSMP